MDETMLHVTHSGGFAWGSPQAIAAAIVTAQRDAGDAISRVFLKTVVPRSDAERLAIAVLAQPAEGTPLGMLADEIVALRDATFGGGPFVPRAELEATIWNLARGAFSRESRAAALRLIGKACPACDGTGGSMYRPFREEAAEWASCRTCGGNQAAPPAGSPGGA